MSPKMNEDDEDYRPVYRAVYRRDKDGVWSVTVPQVPGCHAYGPTLAKARAKVHAAVADQLGSKADFEVAETLPLAPVTQTLLADALVRRDLAREQMRHAIARTREAIEALTNEGLSVRDIGSLLGLSHQRVQQLRPQAAGAETKVSAPKHRRKRAVAAPEETFFEAGEPAAAMAAAEEPLATAAFMEPAAETFPAFAAATEAEPEAIAEPMVAEWSPATEIGMEEVAETTTWEAPAAHFDAGFEAAAEQPAAFTEETGDAGWAGEMELHPAAEMPVAEAGDWLSSAAHTAPAEMNWETAAPDAAGWGEQNPAPEGLGWDEQAFAPAQSFGDENGYYAGDAAAEWGVQYADSAPEIGDVNIIEPPVYQNPDEVADEAEQDYVPTFAQPEPPPPPPLH